MNWLYALVAPMALVLVAYRFGRQPLCERIEEHLSRIQYEHARWIAICLEWTHAGCDEEALLALEQVEALRGEIDFYRRILERFQNTRAKA